MDGNGRWAKQPGNIRLFGHQKGVSTVSDIVTAAAELGIQYLTLYTFSTENWNRPKDEVSGLMNLLISASEKNLEKLLKNEILKSTVIPMTSDKSLKLSKDSIKRINALFESDLLDDVTLIEP